MKARHRHPVEVTADRLTDHFLKYYEVLDDRERDNFGDVVRILREIAEGER